jgi:hypothetical protein
MTITPGAGNYMVWFSAAVDNTNQNKVTFVSIYVGGTLVTHTVRKRVQGTSVSAIQSYISNVTAGQAIEVYWKVDGGTGQCYERTLTIMKI